jgi:hypothetical protein
MLRRSFWVLLCLAGPAAAQQELGHRFDVTPSREKAAVGDPITLRFRVALHERDLITDSLPRPAGDLPDGVRILAVKKLARQSDRTLVGEASVAVYRTGIATLPTFEIPFLRVTANMRGMIRSEPARVEIASITPPGNPSLKDLKDLAPAGGVDWLPFGIGAAILASLAAAVHRWRRRAAPSVHPPIRPSAHLSDPFAMALERLSALDPADLPAAADVLRGCLAAAGVPALECTSSELLHLLPAHLNGQENRARLSGLLADADLVKFARGRADLAAGRAYHDAARALLSRWRAGTRPSSGASNAAG